MQFVSLSGKISKRTMAYTICVYIIQMQNVK